MNYLYCYLEQIAEISKLATMLRGIPCILILLFSTSCDHRAGNSTQQYVVFESDTRIKEKSFKPGTDQIAQAESRLMDYLKTKALKNESIFVTVLDRKTPLQEQLKYYRRRYFGYRNAEGHQIIKIEFVFVRCGDPSAWKQIEYTNNNKPGCWWSVQYNIDNDKIFELNLRTE